MAVFPSALCDLVFGFILVCGYKKVQVWAHVCADSAATQEPATAKLALGLEPAEASATEFCLPLTEKQKQSLTGDAGHLASCLTSCCFQGAGVCCLQAEKLQASWNRYRNS